MATTISTAPLGIFAKALSLLIKQHEPTNTVFERIKDGFLLFVKYLNEKSKGEGLVAQTGSSFDDLHLCRLLEVGNGRHKFFPPIDFDFMILYTKYEILDKTDAGGLDFQELVRTSETFGIMIPSKFPGYVKLLVSVNGKAKLKDRKGKCDIGEYITSEGFLPNNIFRSKVISGDEGDVEVLYKRQKSSYVASGPALSNIDNEADGYTYDFVQSFPCNTWPQIAVNWIKRHKPGGWPTPEQIQDISQGGCAVVPVGHRQSEEPSLEWRVSFNAAERKLSRSLLLSQRSCYSLVKLLLKANLSSTSILTSYHVKNMMFWFCEQMYGPDEWTDGTLGERIIQLLDYISKALEHQSIPSYFLPPCNLISHRTKAEIDATRNEVVQVRSNIYVSLGLVCCKLQVYEQFNASITTGKSEIQLMLTIYTVFVQLLYKLGILNLISSIATDCFKFVVELNKYMNPYVKNASNAFAAVSLPELLKPLTTAYMQSGNLENAYRLNQIMIENDRKMVEEKYPEVFTNMACYYSYKYQVTQNRADREQHFEKAMEYFKIAQYLINDSPSLYFAIGNFLFTSKRSLPEAIQYLEKAGNIAVSRSDDEALLQIDIPGTEDGKPIYVAGKIASLFVLTSIFMKIDDVYRARRSVRLMSDLITNVVAKQKWSAYQLLAYSFRICSLQEKAFIALIDGKKYTKMNYRS